MNASVKKASISPVKDHNTFISSMTRNTEQLLLKRNKERKRLKGVIRSELIEKGIV